MRKIVLLVCVGIISTHLFTQTYKLETVFSDAQETYLSHWKVLEDLDNSQTDTFSLWGSKLYFDDWASGAYEVEYYKGSAKEVHQFLSEVIKFSEKYREEDKVITYISGVQVKTLKQLKLKYTFVYDRERKVVCFYNLRQWTDILNKFVSYCQYNQINYNNI